ncbi:MFS transporter [Streptomyces sp. M19]
MRSRWWPLHAINLGNFMLLIDVTIVNTALPKIADGLDASFTSLQWVMDIYALALAALLMAAGAAADVYGRRKLYLFGLGVFAVSSSPAGSRRTRSCSSWPAPCRAGRRRDVRHQHPAADGDLQRTRPRGRVRRVGGTSGAAAAIGPVLGGLLTEYVDWRAIFLVNLPLTAIAVWLTVRTIGESRGRRERAWTGRAPPCSRSARAR